MSPLHVVTLATFGGLGGAERSLVELVRRAGDDLRFTVLVPEDGPLVAAVRDAGGTSRVVPWPDALRGLGERAGRKSVVQFARAATSVGILRLRLQAELARLAPDVLLTNGVKAHGLGALLRPQLACPLVWYAREGVEDRPISRLGLRILGRRCDAVIAISRYVASEVRPLVPGPAPIHVVRNIVDVRPELPLPADLRKAPGDVWIGIVAALTPLKGQDVFLDAAARVAPGAPHARFLVVGGEPYATGAGRGVGAALRARAQALGIAGRVDFLGERDDAPAIIANLDVLVQASRGPEGLGRTILEAMACGVSVVAVDAWGPRELVVDGRTGCLVPPGDAAALGDRLAALVRDPALRTRLGSAAREAFAADNDPAALAGLVRDALYAIARRARPVETSRDDTIAMARGA